MTVQTPHPLAPALTPALPGFCEAPSDGVITGGTAGTGETGATITDFCPGFSLHASPELGLEGTWRSPTGRVLELELSATGKGEWMALHLRLEGVEDLNAAWIGFACRHAGPEQHMIRPALRSGDKDGFSDCFFDKHILAMAQARNHLDAVNLATTRAIPRTAPWRELVLFLPPPEPAQSPAQTLRWDLHDLRVFRL